MSGYNRSCNRADSSILLAAQCAAALSIMPASAPSCWAQGLQPRHTRNMPFGFLLRVGFYGRDHRGSAVLLPTGPIFSEYSNHDILTVAFGGEADVAWTPQICRS